MDVWMSGITHRVRPLPEGVTAEQALGDALANLVQACERVAEIKRLELHWNNRQINTRGQTHEEALKEAEEQQLNAEHVATRVLFSVGRWQNPPY
jgi:hypothetical protein